MLELTAYSTVALSLGLAIARPRIGRASRVSPVLAAAIGAVVLFALGVLKLSDITASLAILARPFSTIASIMVLSGAAERAGVLDALAAAIEARAAGSAHRLFAAVFVTAVVSSILLNNDTTVLVVTPAVVGLVRRLYPHRPSLLPPFAFAVFMAAGVAPLAVSNPMNMIVASYAGIGFNPYAVRMLPISAACAVVSFVALRLTFRRDLADAGMALPKSARPNAGFDRVQRRLLVLLVAVVAAYPIAAWAGQPVWLAAVLGAAAACWILRDNHRGAASIVVESVSWETLGFLFGVFLLGTGVKNAGFVERLALLYDARGAVFVGAASAAGSALLNNHPMAILNMLALAKHGAPDPTRVFAALIGGDLGPRLLPIGSLAGLLWLGALRKSGIEISLARFVRVGAVVTLPALAVSLLVCLAER